MVKKIDVEIELKASGDFSGFKNTCPKGFKEASKEAKELGEVFSGKDFKL